MRTCTPVPGGTVPRVCVACKHPAREEIDAALIRGETLEAIVGRHRGLSLTGLEQP